VTYRNESMTTTPTTSKLPDTPSALIRVALADLKKCEAMPGYRIDMTTFHTPTSNDVCLVCLAGAVMAQTLGVMKGGYSTPAHCPEELEKLIALDCFRVGDVEMGLCELGIEAPQDLLELWRGELEFTDYHDDPAQFHQDMEALAKELEAHGL